MSDPLKNLPREERVSQIKTLLKEEGMSVRDRSKEGRLKMCNIIANYRGGRCLNTEYVNNCIKMVWECDKGHRWKATTANIKNQGAWCPGCGGSAPYTIEKLGKIFEENGFSLLDEQIKKGGIMAKYYVRHKKCGYTYEVRADNIINMGQGCPKCAERVPYTIERLRKRASENGFTLLDGEIKKGGAYAKYWVKCKKCGYKNEVRASSIIHRGCGCPNCRNKTENTIRIMMEWAIRYEFPHYSPKTLKGIRIYLMNMKGNCMELDGYCPSFVVSPQFYKGTAFEYHGEYHTNGDSHIYDMLKDPDAFERRKEDDRQKREQCKEQGILLIEIWSENNIVYPNFSKIYGELVRVLKENGIETDRPNISDTEWMRIIYPQTIDSDQTTLL